MILQEFRPDDARMAAFRSLAPSLYRDEAVSPGAICLLLHAEGEPVARCTLEHLPELDGMPTTILGHYEARNAEAGIELLRRACAGAVETGSGRVVGPMNGSTWARYRLTLPPDPETDPAEVRPFLTEPQNPPGYPEQFRNAEFQVAALYESRIVPQLPVGRPRATALAKRVRSAGISVTTSQPDRFEAEVDELYHFSSRVFTGNAYYRPIPLALFRHGYAAMRPWLDPSLALLARDAEGRLVGFCFAFPDPLGSTVSERRVVLKTLAAAPELVALGIGAHLADELHQRAAKQGYTAVVHALMHAENDSVKLSHRFGSRLFRRYALYQWTP